MRTADDIATFQAMQQVGGSFERALGKACELADDKYLERIKAAFPELWQEHAENAKWLRVARQKASA